MTRAQLNIRGISDATGLDWEWEHTGGNCRAAVAYLTPNAWRGPYLMITTPDGPWSFSDDPATDEPEECFMLGFYLGGEDEGRVLVVDEKELYHAVRMVKAACWWGGLPRPNVPLTFDEAEAAGLDGTMRST